MAAYWLCLDHAVGRRTVMHRTRTQPPVC
ncbi:uncharacterized protein METZ01_LOCUS13999 [marine metagenome]|uniref:Uncharacterized protein n=1 Tax=marine metagenome TaxID=408172 RepID=A0A381P2I0_9ZZZZ